MKKTFFGFLITVTVAFALQSTLSDVQASGFFDPCDAVKCDPCVPIENECAPVRAGGFFINGHMEAGFFANAHGAKSTYNSAHNNSLVRGADTGSGNTIMLPNTRLAGVQINQVYLSMGRAVDGRRGFDIGGTVDFSWGSDAWAVQAAGLEYSTGRMGVSTVDWGYAGGRWGTGDYFAAFPQAYVEAAAGRWNVKAGKFYLPFGSSRYKSTDNFFYSWASTAHPYYVPHVGGGAYATYKVNDRLSVLGGWVVPSEFGESSKKNAVLGGITWTPGKRLNVQYTFASGKNTYAAFLATFEPPGHADRYDEFFHSLVTTAQISNRLKYVFEWMYSQARCKKDGNFVHGYYAYGINNELIYQMNKRWALGMRFGMLNDDDDDELYTVALGANWTPNKWLTVKPEVRYDWVKAADRNPPWYAFNNGGNTYQLSGGMSAVVKF